MAGPAERKKSRLYIFVVGESLNGEPKTSFEYYSGSSAVWRMIDSSQGLISWVRLKDSDGWNRIAGHAGRGCPQTSSQWGELKNSGKSKEKRTMARDPYREGSTGLPGITRKNEARIAPLRRGWKGNGYLCRIQVSCDADSLDTAGKRGK